MLDGTQAMACAICRLLLLLLFFARQLVHFCAMSSIIATV
jgi:hypothetical protein